MTSILTRFRELKKIKQKLAATSKAANIQTQFIRLILQKMDIRTEADDVDEGVSLKRFNTENYKWVSPRIRKNIKSVFCSKRANST
ncbi:transient receptor potential cation channel subfamily A member 1-like [Rhynchophorus ferrugineus]|uniref:Uncharacterized protein n=1 Tax=Rhynchophorus ferrugineus TaxID=354439 RepID=A0A834M5N5_RHYFE|nr:hypothetical protein GWI33_020739 [Rhynchophorus ferrugineus]